MIARSRALALACIGAALSAAACGKEEFSLAPVCTDQDSVTWALARAPRPVTLDGSVKLSRCVDQARSDGDLQSVGMAFGNVARDLASRARQSDRAATSLGYLVGAAHKGSEHSNGIHSELVRRLEQSMSVEGPPPERRAAYAEGLAAGSQTG